jgi:tetratricopeptide (TPR) repeat protein
MLPRCFRPLRLWLSAIVLCLTGCAVAPPTVVPSTPSLFDDSVFATSIPRVGHDDIFAINDAMRAYIRDEIATEAKTKGRALALFDALYRQGSLKLDYDASVTRNAADTFAAKSGNCLALTIMTAAFAREMGLHVRFQSIPLEEQWTRVNGLYVASGHVNITLSGDPAEPWRIESRQRMTIDFFPPSETRGRKPKPIPEARIVAMYMNNQAAEALMRQRYAEAYAWARSAILRDADFTIAHNTLGVVYRRVGAYAQAAIALDAVLKESPDHLQALSNLAVVRADQGRLDESQALMRRIAQLQPEPPYHFFKQGQLAYHRGDLASARDYFEREVKRAGYNAEFQYWLALTLLQMGQARDAQRHLDLAVENSATAKERSLYAGKLKQLRL